ncbi:UBA/THIF-type NAD/FAD-binding protein [Tepidicaulis marinus]|jgi:adenylyltransferase/sulfurtransferase|uniref:Molybdopterin-synthase adenylyltransferase n=1 Tax=Tepidicaulis marinus TaxID=1333998 RepID=A0A081B714_9HYPH|nr:molybdopterin-synthase adenylyltransferase MoeB [Tepidicaulis marinus]GAK43832.1 UBA/THIF-type NAD/FAD-binding protein [Tepidicaulis marinus]
MALSDTQLERYARHIVLKEIGGPGQQKLLGARVLVIGAGGLGSPALLYLAAAGAGTLGIIDDDKVSLSNLQRQIIHDTDHLDAAKTQSAAAAIARLNPDVKVELHEERLTAQNALEIISRYDIVADGCDNFATRFLVSDACFLARRPLVSAAVGPFEGQLATFKPYEKDEEGTPLPTYRCLVPEAPAPGSIPTCESAGVLGALTGVMGSLQALEVIKEITGAGESLTGKLLIYDALDTRFRTIKLKRDPANPLNGENASITDLSHHA